MPKAAQRASSTAKMNQTLFSRVHSLNHYTEPTLWEQGKNERCKFTESAQSVLAIVTKSKQIQGDNEMRSMLMITAVGTEFTGLQLRHLGFLSSQRPCRISIIISTLKKLMDVQP